MTRQEVMKIFPTATEEQITAFLNANNSEVQTEKEKAKELKDTSKELEDAQKELAELRVKAETGAPDDWKAQIDKLTESNEKAQATIRNMQLKNSLLGKGISEEDADAYINAVSKGEDVSVVFEKIMTNAISKHDKERMDATPDPSGSGQTPPEEKGTAEKLVSGLFDNSKSNTQSDILANYK